MVENTSQNMFILIINEGNKKTQHIIKEIPLHI